MQNNWQQITQFFQDPVVWQKRLAQWQNSGFDNLDLFTQNCEQRNQYSNYVEFVEKIIHADIPGFDGTKYIKSIENLNHTFYYSIPQLSRFIYLSVRQIFFQYFGEKPNYQKLCSSLVDDFMPNIIRSIEQALKFEYELYLTAYEQEDNKDSLLYFVCCMTTDKEWIEYFFESYPVATRRIQLLINNYLDFVSNFFSHIQNDFEELTDCFGIPKDAEIASITTCLGDLHFSGSSTSKIVFADTNSTQLFYKPHSPNGDTFFYEIIEYLEHLGLKESLTKINYLPRENYFWQQEVKKENLTSEKEIRDFYYNQGINCAFAFAFNIEDLIADNVIASSSKPAFFDLEILLKPEHKAGENYWSRSMAGKTYGQSVIKTGLLPEFGFETLDDPGYSNAGLSKNQGDVKNHHLNLPLLNGEVVTIDKYCKDFEEGFIYAYRFLMEHQEAIISKVDELLNQPSKNFPIRVLIRYTYIYSHVLEKLSSAECLQDHLLYHQLLDSLWRGYDEHMITGEVIQSEINQIDIGDYPIFYTYATSRDLFDGTNQLIVKDYFENSGKDHAVNKLKSLSEDDLKEQLNIIKRSLIVHNDYETQLISKAPINTHLPLTNQISQYVLGLNIDKNHNQDYFTYIDYIITKDSMWSQSIQGCDIFQGIIGVGLFLLAQYKLTQDENLLDQALKTFNQTQQHFDTCQTILNDMPAPATGMMHFPLSLLYFSVIGRKILNSNRFGVDANYLSTIHEYLLKSLHQDENIDYLFGIVGTALLLMDYEENYPDFSFKKVIHQIGQYIFKTANYLDKDRDRVTWRTRSFDEWGGFAHGNGSISYLLFKLHQYTGQVAYRDLAIKALNYDQSLYNEELGHWQKTYEFVGDIHQGWASGTAGIGLSRHLIAPYYSNDFMFKELELVRTKLETSLEYYFERDHSICSGFLGMLEVYEIIYGKNDCYQNWLQKYSQDIKQFDQVRSGGWEKDQIITGLYYGVTGIGYNTIKLQNEHLKLPSLLWL